MAFSSKSHRLSLFLCVCFTIVAVLVESVPPSTLRHVNFVFRHGDRSPDVIFPTDINKIGLWPDGLRWLTNIGKQQQYELGIYLRQRYGGFINVTRYNHRQISIQSSAKERCVMSLQANLAGMFPAQGDQVWSDVYPTWQPMPFTTIPTELDNKIQLSAKCPRYDQLYHDMVTGPAAMEYRDKHLDFLTMLYKKSGWEKELAFDEMWKTVDPVICERAHNLTLNDWLLEEGVLDQVTELQHFAWELRYCSPEMAKLKGGPLLNEMIDNMKAACNGSSGDLKAHMYSGHDYTLSALLHAMTVPNGLQPRYASLLMLELHTVDHQDVVKIFFRNETNSDPYYLVPEGCEDPCHLSTFQTVMASVIPQNWDEECNV